MHSTTSNSSGDSVHNNSLTKKWKKFPYQIVKVDFNINSQLLRDFRGETKGYVQVGPEKWCLPIRYEQEAEIIYNFEVRPDDVWLVCFPRTGSTWTQEMIWLMLNNFDYETAASVPSRERFPFFEYGNLRDSQTTVKTQKGNAVPEEELPTSMWKVLDKQVERRFIKTHLPLSLLPPDLLTSGCKVIYLARNPKDVCASYFHLCRLITFINFVNDFETFWNYFEKDLVQWAPYWSHIKEGWKQRHSKDFLFLFYEDLNANLHNGIKQIGDFFDVQLTDIQYKCLEKYLQIENFRKNKSVNGDYFSDVTNIGEQPFIRKGKNGSWKEEFSAELNKRADVWIKENLKNTDLQFPL